MIDIGNMEMCTAAIIIGKGYTKLWWWIIHSIKNRQLSGVPVYRPMFFYIYTYSHRWFPMKYPKKIPGPSPKKSPSSHGFECGIFSPSSPHFTRHWEETIMFYGFSWESGQRWHNEMENHLFVRLNHHIFWLVGQGHPCQKYDFVNWDD